jgi:hypothetical protein
MNPPLLLETGPSPFGWHRYESFLRCPQLYAWGHEAPAEPEGDTGRALAMGSLVHVGIAHHYARMREVQHGRDPDVLFHPVDAVRELVARKREDNTYVECSGTAQDIVAQYLVRYANERVKILHVEEVFTLNFDGAPLTMRVDLVWEGSDGRVYFVDHKTTGRITTSHPRWYSMSGQFLGYRWAGRLAFGERFGGAVCNLIQTDPKAITFARPNLSPVPGMLRKFPDTIREAWRRLQEIKSRNLPPTEWPAHPSEHTCWTRYGACPAYARCEWSTPPAESNE